MAKEGVGRGRSVNSDNSEEKEEEQLGDVGEQEPGR